MPVARREAEALKLQARLEDLNVWQMEKVKQSRKGTRTYTYWMASWREDDKTRQCPPGKRQGDGCRGCRAKGLWV